MEISFDPAKRKWTLEERGIDFLDAPLVFAEPHFTIIDDRRDYGEERWRSFGTLRGRLTVVVWTQRSEARHIISMRHAHEHEVKARRKTLD